MLAHCWTKCLKDRYEIILSTNNNRPDLIDYKTTTLNFSSTNNLKKDIIKLNVNIIINCMGFTNIESCEKNPNIAFKINSVYPGLIANISKELGIKFVHISTDHLFDGKKSFYKENDSINPLNIYAKTKHDGEKNILKVNSNALIIRTNFFGWGPSYKNSFSDFILNNLENNNSISLFTDVFYSPIIVSELSNTTNKLLEKKFSGIFNVVSNERISKYDFGIMLANEFNMDKSLIKKSKFSEREDLVLRPRDMSLSTNKLESKGIKIKFLKEQIKELKSQVLISKNKIIPYGRQNVNNNDIDEVVKVLKSDYLTQGPIVLNFEKEVAKYTGSNFGIAVNSATSALHISCLALGLKEGDLVWTTPISFVASANCAKFCGADVDFVDIDSKTYNISINALSKKLEIAKKENKLPKIVIPVHLSGQSCEMEEINELSKQYGFKIIEDASHGIGGRYKGNPIGSCKYSDITVFSFHPVKIITSGEGGMCTTNNSDLANLLARYRSHGITRHEDEMTKKSDGPWFYQQLELGFNYRMTDIQAALGLSQLKKLDDFIIKRHEISKRYDLAFSNDSIITPFQHPDNYSSYHLYIIRLKHFFKGLDKFNLFNRLRNAGVLVNLHYIPIYKQPYYEKIGYDYKNFPESEEYYLEAISLPIHTLLSKEDQDFIIEIILNFIGKQKSFIINSFERELKGYQNIF